MIARNNNYQGLKKYSAGIYIVIAMLITSNTIQASASNVIDDIATDILITPEPREVSKSETSSDVLSLNLSPYINYDYQMIYKPWWGDKVKDVVVEGAVVEVSTPARKFNLLVLDEINFELWTEKRMYEAYYEESKITSTDFILSFKDEELPDWLYVVVYSDREVVVKSDVKISWVEEAYKWSYTDYHSDWYLPLISGSSDTVRVEGKAEEVNGKRFKFYVLDSDNYLKYSNDKPYRTLYEAEVTGSIDFSIPLQNESIWLYFVVENVLRDETVTVNLNAVIREGIEEIEEFNVPLKGIQEKIKIRGILTSGKVESITVDQELNGVVMKLSDVDKDAQLTVRLPPELIQPADKDEFENATFSVYATHYTNILNFRDSKSSDGSRTLTIELPAGTENVIITTNNVRIIPEFGAVAGLILAASVIGIVILSIFASRRSSSITAINQLG